MVEYRYAVNAKVEYRYGVNSAVDGRYAAVRRTPPSTWVSAAYRLWRHCVEAA